MRNLTVLSMLMLCCLAGCAMEVATSEHHLELTERETERDLKARVGDTIEIALPSNVTTGYSWVLGSPDQGAVVKAGEEHDDINSYDNGMGGRVGAGGKTTFTFRANATGRKVIEFDYVRPWEKDKPPGKVVTVRVDVE